MAMWLDPTQSYFNPESQPPGPPENVHRHAAAPSNFHTRKTDPNKYLFGQILKSSP